MDWEALTAAVATAMAQSPEVLVLVLRLEELRYVLAALKDIRSAGGGTGDNVYVASGGSEGNSSGGAHGNEGEGRLKAVWFQGTSWKGGTCMGEKTECAYFVGMPLDAPPKAYMWYTHNPPTSKFNLTQVY